MPKIYIRSSSTWYVDFSTYHFVFIPFFINSDNLHVASELTTFIELKEELSLKLNF